MRKKSLDRFKKAVSESVIDLRGDIVQAVVDELRDEDEFSPSLSIGLDGVLAVWLAGACSRNSTWEELIHEFCEDADLQEEDYIEDVISKLRWVADEIEKRYNAS